jgi:23S rRNA U2552 (ribose-2'-O)-methylase RlmE/FtsJ
MEHAKIIESKNKIENIASHAEWELRKKITNPYEAIFSGNTDNTFPSLAKVHPLSRSYFKMIEMFSVSDFWKRVDQTVPFKSAHVCEGPGGFIQATIEKLKAKHIPIDAIYAMTLRPTKPHIPGWRRSIQFLRKYPEIKLEYGEDDTGNILLHENQKSFSDKANGSQLFTADGGFDFSVDYANQEQMAFPLLVASFIIGLTCLAKGGTMIIKLFDIYSPATIDLFLGTARLFESFTLYKPATSRPCNSERYFIANAYNGPTHSDSTSWVEHLRYVSVAHKMIPITRLFENPWPAEILQAVREHIEAQELQQINVIEATLNFDKSNLEKCISNNLKMSKMWCEEFEVPYSV